jgi:flagellar M-ring protein FliF
VLFANVGDRDGGAIIQALGQMNVPYKYADGGGTILVPADKVHDARLKLASQGLPKGGTVGFELVENQKFGTTQFQEQVNYQRALEGELARTVQSLAAVQSARVHLAIPKAAVFLRDQQKPSASVLVNLHPGRSLDRAQVTGIVHLVSSSVPDLPPRAVSVVDGTGALLSGPSETKPGAQLDASQLAYVTQIEANLARRVQEILEPVVGRTNIRAQVTAELDFSESEATAETYKPNGAPENAAIRSQQTMESMERGPGAGGVPGALTNQPAPAATAPIGGSPASANAKDAPKDAPPLSSRKEATVNYEVDRTVRTTRTPTGTVKRLSAAVVVNHRREAPPADAPPAADAKGAKSAPAPAKPKLVPLSQEEMAQITALAKEAIGFSQARGDSINVVNAAFTVEQPEPAPELPLWKQPETVAVAKDFGKYALLALVGLYLVLGVLRPLLRQAMAPPAPRALAGPGEQAVEGEVLQMRASPGAYVEQLQAVKQLAKQDPKLVANVVRSWVSSGS